MVPAEKGLSAAWIKSLTDRGTPEVWRGQELRYIGLPVGGICAGLVYLGGDGKLWLWDVFNRDTTHKKITYGGKTFANGDGSTYVEPLVPRSPFAQGFALKYQAKDVSGRRTLDKEGRWADIDFLGPYPLGVVNYRDPAVPVAVRLEAFSPFIPLNVDDSSLPATVMRYTVTNTSQEPVRCELAGWLENAVLASSSPEDRVTRRNRVIRDASGQGILLSGTVAPVQVAPQPDIVFADFSDGTYNGWTVEGQAFGQAPVARKDLPPYMQNIGGQGEYVVTSHNFRDAPDNQAADDLVGKLTSREFTVERRFITFESSGGKRPNEAGVRLLVDGRAVLEQTGANSNRLTPRAWSVVPYLGKKAKIEVFDQAKGAWGNVHVGGFVFTDKEPAALSVEKRHDYGTMALYLVDAGAGVSPVATLAAGQPEETVFQPEADAGAAKPPVAGLTKTFDLPAGGSTTVSFVISWHFPNVDPKINGPDTIHAYAVRFADAGAVARYVADDFTRLAGETLKWSATWNDSTLPHWFLNRTFGNTCNLATTTSYRFADGQFWAWEGIYSCEGTCTHVWGYAQAMSRIFPELERALREKTDFAFAQDPKSGTINFRGTHGGFAADGQAGNVLRTYREHLMTTDCSFLQPLWPRVRLAMDRLIQQDNGKGLLDGPQHNTLDTSWYGEVAWISGLYLAALRAAEEMAKAVGDNAYAGRCRQLFDLGARSIVSELFNGEYFINKVDPRHLDAINSGTGCEIDQVMGQSWAWQVGLGRIFPQKETVTALKSLWRYNFSPDAGHYHEVMKVGRWYAMPGEAGLLVCTFPKPDWNFQRASGKGPLWAALYFNECQSGYEHEAAANMIAEGLLEEGLGVTRAIHDRYAPAKRNPYNEIECGDHYSRAMASYGSFITVCGFEYRGPDGYIAFAPKLTPESFKAAFTAAKGWGSYAQAADETGLQATLAVNWGELTVNTLGLQPARGFRAKAASLEVNGRSAAAKLSLHPTDDRVEVRFAEPLVIKAGESVRVLLS